MSLNLQSFFAQLDEIRLIDVDLVRAVAEEIGATDGAADAKALGQELINRGHLTAFQVSALLTGRGNASNDASDGKQLSQSGSFITIGGNSTIAACWESGNGRGREVAASEEYWAGWRD